MLEQAEQKAVGGGWQVPSVLHSSDFPFSHLLEKLPAGAYTCNAEGLITYFNQYAVQLWGRAPKLYDPIDRFCGSFKLFSSDGAPLAHDQCWMALALKMGKAYDGCEIIVERPDGQRFTVLAHANPIYDEAGKLLGAVNVLVDITERKQVEEARGSTWRPSSNPRMMRSSVRLSMASSPAGTGGRNGSTGTRLQRYWESQSRSSSHPP
jgi:PAS domain-containing protein